MSLVENRGGGSASCDDAREDSANVSEAVRPLLDILYGAQSTTAQHSTRAWLFVSHASSLLAAASRAEEIECFCRSLRPDAALPLALVLDILSECIDVCSRGPAEAASVRNAFNILRNVALSIKMNFSDHWTAELSLRARRLIVAAIQLRGLSTGSRACSLLLASLALGVDPILDLTADCIDVANVRNPWLREAHRFSSLSSFRLVVCEIDQFFDVARHAGIDVPHHTALVPGVAISRCLSPDSSALDGGGGSSSVGVITVAAAAAATAAELISVTDLEPLCRFVAKRDAFGAMTSLLILIRRRAAYLQQLKTDASVSDVAAGIHDHAVQALRQSSTLPPGELRSRALPALPSSSSSSPPPLPWEGCHDSFHLAMIESVVTMNRCKLDADAKNVAHAMVAVAVLGGWTRTQFESISVAAFRAPFFTRHPAWLLVLMVALSNFDAAALIALSAPAHLSGWTARAVLSAKEEFGTAFDDMVACLCRARHVQWPIAPAVGKLHAQPSVYAPYSELQAAEIALALQPAAEAALQQIMSHYRARDVDSFISAARSIYDTASAGAEALRAAFTVIEIRCCRNVNGVGGSDALMAAIDPDRGLALWVIVLEKCLAAWVDMAAASLTISSSEFSGDQGGSSSGCSGLASMMGSAAFGLYQFLLIRAVCMLRRLPSPPLYLIERVRRSLEMLLASERIVVYHTEHMAVHCYWVCVALKIDPDTLHRGAAPRNWVASAAAHRNDRKYAKHILQQLFDSVVEPTVAVEASVLPLVAPNAIAAAAESRSDCSVVEWLPGDCNDVEFDAACRSSATGARDGGRLPMPIGWSRKLATKNSNTEAAFQPSVPRPSSAAGGGSAAIATVPPPSFMLLQQPDVDRIMSLAAQAISLAAGAKQAADECRSLLLRVGIDAAQATTAEEDDPRQERGGGTA